jgi:hypothetical protein
MICEFLVYMMLMLLFSLAYLVKQLIDVPMYDVRAKDGLVFLNQTK